MPGRLRNGVHTVTISAPDGCDGKAVRSIRIDVKPRHTHKHTSSTHGTHTHGKDAAGGVARDDGGPSHQEH